MRGGLHGHCGIELVCAIVFAAGSLLVAGNASGQFTGQVKVSNSLVGSGVYAARCGTNIVVGFGESGSKYPSSFDGYSVSKNGGSTFSDLGVLPIASQNTGYGPDNMSPYGVSCANSSDFYYVSTYQNNNTCPSFPQCFGISISTSTNGGTSWGLPVIVDQGTADSHSLYSPSAAAVDPTNTQRLYVAYIYQNGQPLDQIFPDCVNASVVYVVKVAGSKDGGKTWTPSDVDHTCNNSANTGNPDLRTPQVVVSPTGAVYVTYEFDPITSPATPNKIMFASSSNFASTFSTPVRVSNDAIDNAMPQIGVNRTNSPHRGSIFITWSGSPAGTYTDVLVSDSLNAGVSFSFPRPISPTPSANAGRFQSNPVIAVDNDGQVQTCFYNAGSNAPTSSSTYSYNCATSFNNAATWQIQRVVNSAPVGSDAVTSDFLTHHDGFFTAFGLQNNGTRRVVGQFSDIN
jgi:hypothetical protein